MLLLDLPSEILRIIFKELGAAQLRRSVTYLLICRSWYQLAHEVFLSAIPLKDLRFSAHDLQLLPPEGSALMNLICESTKNLSIRLVGHPSPEISETPWTSLVEVKEDDDEVDLDSVANGSEADDVKPVWETSGIDAEKASHSATLSSHPQQAWMRRINQRLVEIANRMVWCTRLEEFTLEASSEQEAKNGPRWDYIYDVSLAKLITNIPDNLMALTIDTCGTGMFSASGHPLHLCPLIAQHVGKIRKVRIRMRSICPVIFNMAGSILAVESLIIKISLPMFGDYAGGNTYFDAKRCHAKETAAAWENIHSMRRAAQKLTRRHHFGKLRISFRKPTKNGINLVTWDGVTDQFLCDPSGNFSYEDDGRSWEAWEEGDALHVCPGIA